MAEFSLCWLPGVGSPFFNSFEFPFELLSIRVSFFLGSPAAFLYGFSCSVLAVLFCFGFVFVLFLFLFCFVLVSVLFWFCFAILF